MKDKIQRKGQKSSKSTAATLKESSIQEIEIVDGRGIFNEDEDDLKHDMIDTSKAKSMVTALKYLKR